MLFFLVLIINKMGIKLTEKLLTFIKYPNLNSLVIAKLKYNSFINSYFITQQQFL